jgi:hypothetical protein
MVMLLFVCVLSHAATDFFSRFFSCRSTSLSAAERMNDDTVVPCALAAALMRCKSLGSGKCIE